MSTIHDVQLICHPTTRSRAVQRIGVRVSRVADASLAFTYTIEGDLARLRVPEHRQCGFADQLWEHTCCETFIARAGDDAYHEFNFSPSTQWAIYAFRGYRDRVTLASDSDISALDPKIVLRSGANTLQLDALIDFGRVAPNHASAALSLAISTVIEDEDGTISYWALRHPPGDADFHHADGFALTL